MFQYISAKPSIQFKDIFQKNNKKVNVYPLNQEKCYSFFSARYALAAAIKALGFNENDMILLPSYNCAVEIDPITYLGVKPGFYKIDKNLLIDFEDLLSKITGVVRGILVTHFMGFPQAIDEIRDLCIKKNLILIEDCAHAFLSMHKDRPLGSFGDAAIFSLLKTLPIPNGGVLVLNGQESDYANHRQAPSILSTVFSMAELLHLRTWNANPGIDELILRFLINTLYISSKFAKLLVAVFRRILNPEALYLVRPDSYYFKGDLIRWGISSLSSRLISNEDFGEIKKIRRRNFEYLLNYFLKNERGILPFKDLPPGVCPLFFPIILDNSKKRSDLYRTLKRRGIITHPWWDIFHPIVPWREFPDAVYLKECLLGLPIQQDLTFEHLKIIVQGFEEAYSTI